MVFSVGGDDFDDVIVEWLAATHLPGIDWKQPAVLTNLKALAEAAKVSSRGCAVQPAGQTRLVNTPAPHMCICDRMQACRQLWMGAAAIANAIA